MLVVSICVDTVLICFALRRAPSFRTTPVEVGRLGSPACSRSEVSVTMYRGGWDAPKNEGETMGKRWFNDGFMVVALKHGH